MKSLKYALAIMSAFFPIASFAADPNSGNHWYEMCISQATWEGGHCLGYIDGVHSGIMAQAHFHGDERPYCLTDGVTVGQMRDVFLKHLSNHPETRNFNAAGLFYEAMLSAFPCVAPSPKR